MILAVKITGATCSTKMLIDSLHFNSHTRKLEDYTPGVLNGAMLNDTSVNLSHILRKGRLKDIDM